MTKKALLIGINYKNTKNELNGCINDIQNIKSFLTTNCDYNLENICVMTDEEKLLPTRANIEDKIKWLVSNNLKGDTLVFYYSGHGSYVRDLNKDETDCKDECIIPLDYEESGEILDDWLFSNMISKISTGISLYCFTDCCHSGTIMDLQYNCKSLCQYKKSDLKNCKNYISTDWTDKYSFSVEASKKVKGNVVLFSGCQDKETSADAYIKSKSQSQGAFTFCLLEILNNNLDKRNKLKKLKLRDILKEVNCRLDINGYDQNSQLSTCRLNGIDKTLDI